MYYWFFGFSTLAFYIWIMGDSIYYHLNGKYKFLMDLEQFKP